MGKYVLKTILFLIPFLIIFTITELWLREIDLFNVKKKNYEKNKNDIELLLLGPSHFVYGLNPALLDLSTANLAEEGSAFNIDYLMLNRLLPELPKLKFLILDLSLGNLERSNPEDWFKNHLYYLYYGVQNFSPSWKDHFLLTSKFGHYRKMILKKIKGEKNQYNKYGFMISRFKHERRFSDLLAGLNKGKEVFERQVKSITGLDETNYKRNTDLLKKIIETCKEKDVKVILLSTPSFHLINERFEGVHLNRRNEIIKKIIDINGVYFWNYERTFEADTNMFYDPIHLNVYGAKIFTKEINKRLMRLSSTNTLSSIDDN